MTDSTTRKPSLTEAVRQLLADPARAEVRAELARDAEQPSVSRSGTLASRAYWVTVTTHTTYLVQVPAVTDVLAAVPEDEAEQWAQDHYVRFGTWKDEEDEDIETERCEPEDEYDEPEDADEIRARLRAMGMDYYPGETPPPPPPLPGGRVLVHNFPPLVDGEVVPDQRQGVNGFRFWLQDRTAPEAPPLVACGCGWAPGHAVHYQPGSARGLPHLTPGRLREATGPVPVEAAAVLALAAPAGCGSSTTTQRPARRGVGGPPGRAMGCHDDTASRPHMYWGRQLRGALARPEGPH